MTDEDIERLKTLMVDRAARDGAYAIALMTFALTEAVDQHLAGVAQTLARIAVVLERINEKTGLRS